MGLECPVRSDVRVLDTIHEPEHGVLPIDESVARRAAALHVPDPAPFRDALIGATALVHQLTVVTRNVRDFQQFPELAVLDPWR